MNQRLPSPNALRVFEAAARHGKFARAAKELHVTPAAVSQQIKALENQLGVSLFHRRGRDVVLTETGQRILPGLQDGFQRIAKAIEEAWTVENSRILTITLGPAFTTKWLVPRLHRFRERHPDIDVRFSMHGEPIDETAVLKTDLAVRFGDGVYPGYRIDLLFEEVYVPLCSPRLLEGARPLRSPGDLRHHVLLHTAFQTATAAAPDWVDWLAIAGCDDVDPNEGLHLEAADHALQAAIDGAGVILGHRRLADADINAGRLVQPFPIRVPSDMAFYLICPEANAGRPKIRAFREWMLEEVAVNDGRSP
jgi:LysR family transcriptional regulator, glycine cleavage system transcriptional activator